MSKANKEDLWEWHIGMSVRKSSLAETQCRGDVPKGVLKFTVTQPLRYPLKSALSLVFSPKGFGTDLLKR